MVNIYDLVSQAQAAEMLGVTPQRVGQLRKQHPDFPAPAYESVRIALFRRSDIKHFGMDNGYIKRF